MNIDISFDSYLELEKISNGSFHPLQGFMTEEDFISVCNKMRLQNGKLFPLPVILPLLESHIDKIKIGQEITLQYQYQKVGSLIAEDIFKPDFLKFKKKLFGTEDNNHPGYIMLKKMGKYFIGGRVNSFFEIKHRYSKYTISPKDCITKINDLGFKTVAAFQTRNVPHRAHEYILLDALNEVDGLFIHPLIGKKKIGDFLPDAVMESYKYLIDNIYPKEKIILGALTTYMRYAGPREAIFHALIRRNFGCTHFLVGRDHAGVGKYYGEYEAQNLCIKLEKEINIKIIKVRGPFYCKYCKKITTDKNCIHPESRIEVSGTKIRKALIDNLNIKDIFMRKQIVSLLKNRKVFIDKDEL